MSKNSNSKKTKNLPLEFNIIGKSLLKISNTQYKPLKASKNSNQKEKTKPPMPNNEKVPIAEKGEMNESIIFSEYSFLNNAQQLDFGNFKTTEEISQIINSVISINKEELIKSKNMPNYGRKEIDELFEIDWLDIREAMEYEEFVNSASKLFGLNEKLDIMYFATAEDIINFEEFAPKALEFCKNDKLTLENSVTYKKALNKFLKRNINYVATLADEKSELIWNFYRIYTEFEFKTEEEILDFFNITNKIMKDNRRNKFNSWIFNPEAKSHTSTGIICKLTYLCYPEEITLQREILIKESLEYIKGNSSKIDQELIKKLIKKILRSEKLKEIGLVDSIKLNEILIPYNSIISV